MTQVTLKVMKVSQPIGDFYISSADYKEILKISYADIRRMPDEHRPVETYLGIQRPLEKRRVDKIRQYVNDSKDATFPTAIVLAVDQKCAEYNEEKGELKIFPYDADSESEDEDIKIECVAKILDGQHRLAALAPGYNNGQESFNLDQRTFNINVSIFVGIDISDQARIFSTVNLTQTKVNRSLVYDLEEYEKTRTPYKSCHDIAVALDDIEESPFHKRIKRLGVKTPGRNHEPLTQASFVESLVTFISDDPVKDRNVMIRNQDRIFGQEKLDVLEFSKRPFRKFFLLDEEGDLIMYNILFKYFSAVRRKWPNSWNSINLDGNLLPKANSFKALMRYLRNDVLPQIAGLENFKLVADVPDEASFDQFFEHIDVPDGEFDAERIPHGSGGEAAFYKLLQGKS